MTDWTVHFTRSEQALKKASEAMLLGKHEEGMAEIVKAKAYLDMVLWWIVKQ